MKKRFDKLLLCGLLICALAMPVGFAEDESAAEAAPETQPQVTQVPETPVPATAVPETPAPATPVPETPAPAAPEPATEEPTQIPTEAPSPEPTQAPTQEPSSEPTQVPTEAPSSEPTQVPTQEPSSEPTQAPTEDATSGPDSEQTPEPTLEPTLEPTIEPTSDPVPDPSFFPTPGPTSLPLPGSIDGLVHIVPEGSAQQDGGIWRIELSAQDSQLSFTWSVSGEASGYLLYVQSEQGEMRLISETSDARISLSAKPYAKGQHTLYVGAYLTDGRITWGKAVFELATQQVKPPAGGFSGGRPGGSKPGGSAAAGQMSQEEQGFRITPGEALTSSHASGTKNTTAYTHSEIEDTAETINALVLSSTQAKIMLDGGAAFFVSKDDGKLQLIPETVGECWRLNALAMNTLAESGIDRVVFHVGGTAYSMPARMEFSGSIYASLRAKGYVSKDMEIGIDAQGMHVYVDGCIYSINDANELVPCEE